MREFKPDLMVHATELFSRGFFRYPSRPDG
jgi:hypothetical protein